MSYNLNYGFLTLTTTAVAVSASVYTATLLAKKCKKLGVRHILLSTELQIVCWDIIRW